MTNRRQQKFARDITALMKSLGLQSVNDNK